MNVFYLAGNVALSAFSAMLIKKSKNIAGSGWYEGLFFTLFVAVFSIAVFLAVNLFRVTLYPVNYIFSFIYALLGIFSTIVGLKAYASGKAATYIIATTIGSTVFPYLFGILFWQESLTVLKSAGMALMIAVFIVKNLPARKPASKDIPAPAHLPEPKEAGAEEPEQERTPAFREELQAVPEKKRNGFLWLCVVGALITGVVNIVVSWNARLAPLTDTVSFSVLTQGYVFVLVAVMMLARFPAVKRTLSVNRSIYGGKNILVSCIYAAACGTALIFSLEAAKTVPASVLFPVTCSGNILLVTLFDSLFYKEKFTKRDFISTLLIIPAIVLVAFG